MAAPVEVVKVPVATEGASGGGLGELRTEGAKQKTQSRLPFFSISPPSFAPCSHALVPLSLSLSLSLSRWLSRSHSF